MNRRKLLRKILSGSKSIRFGDLMKLAEGFGFRLARIEGSHHIMVHPDVPRPLSLQEIGGQAKPYQGAHSRFVAHANAWMGAELARMTSIFHRPAL